MYFDDAIEKLLAGRWVAGHHPNNALEKAAHLNSKHIGALINFLGEDLIDRDDIDNTISTYMNLVYNIRLKKLNADLSVKPTQLGLLISYKLMESNYLKIVEYAKKREVFVWLDMEEPEHINSTIKVYLKAIKYGNVGICIQSYLKRSEKDIQNLQKHKAAIRLVKGAYTIDKRLGFPSKDRINANYLHLMQKLLENSDKFMIATHDDKIIEIARNLNKKYKRKITYAMLNGIRNKYALALAKAGEHTILYVPFGSDWVNYSMRRLKEQGHLSLIVRSMFEKQDI